MLSELIYSSHVLDLSRDDLPRLLQSARASNLAAGVTGVLMLNHKHVLQCLEGGREQVTSIFTRIAMDPRHTAVSLLSVRQIEQRSFPDWTMGYAGTSRELESLYRRFLPSGHFDPGKLSPAGALGLVSAVSELGRAGLLEGEALPSTTLPGGLVAPRPGMSSRSGYVPASD